MTRVDFYVLKPGCRGNRFTLAARLAEKAWHHGHRVLIAVPDEEQQRHMNRLLWTLRDTSFVPHGLLREADPVLNPVLITLDDAGDEQDVLINLQPQIPEFFSRFERVAECVDHDEPLRQASRERYRFYRERGYPLHTHEVT